MATIVFIEDEKALQTTLGNALTEAGYTVHQAFDGTEGIRLVRETHPDLILLDLMLPALSGQDVLSALRADPATAAIPVIVLTNSEDMAHVEEVIKHGVAAYLIKANYSLQEVIDKIALVLHAR